MVKEDGGKTAGLPEEPTNALAARRARLRGSLAKQTVDPSAGNDDEPDNLTDPAHGSTSHSSAKAKSSAAHSKEPVKEPQIEPAIDPAAAIASQINQAVEKLAQKNNLTDQTMGQGQALSLLSNIDQALGSCAMHLASLQKVASKQIDELKVIAQTLQDHTFSEVGTGLNSLMESLTAAVEPMKAVGELVPTLDRLVSASEATSKPQLSEEQLVINLADQLFNGVIDAWTFKSAYMAIFPAEDVANLLHRLSELLGEQRLSGDSFQIAYEAVQTAKAPDSLSSAFATSINQNMAEQFITESSYLVDERLEAEIKQKISDREEELTGQLNAREEEMEDLRTQLDLRLQVLVDECEELRIVLQSREDLVAEKENALNKKVSELAAKDSENQQLRAQMEELRDQTKEMVTDLQKQLAQRHIEEANALLSKSQSQAKPSGFFDFVSTTDQPDNIFEPAATAQLFAEEEEVSGNEQANIAQVELPVQQGQTQPSGAPVFSTPASPQINTKASPQSFASVNSQTNLPTVSQPTAPGQTASFVSAAGSYGSGVRAQVFEVIVRQALAGTHWREICAVPMQINNISPDEVEAEVKRRQALLSK